MGWDRANLADAMIARMNRDEVESLCFHLHVDHESLDSQTKNSLVRSLITHMEQRGQFELLTRQLADMRPDIKPSVQPPIWTRPSGTTALSFTFLPIDTDSDSSPQGKTGPYRMTDLDGVTMVYVPPGNFIMGSSAISDDEKPPHNVTITQGFWLDLTPVTNAMYARFVKTGGYRKPELWTPGGWQWVQANKKAGPHDYEGFTEPDQPRVGITWFEAFAYCRWRGGRLPTEAEWEWAARGPKNRVYPWGNCFDANRVIFGGNSAGKTVMVNAQTRLGGASWVGALDMSGNVWEWTSTLYRPYPYNAMDGREELDDNNRERVGRGGSWGLNGDLLQGAFRYRVGPSYANYSLGIRCARSS